MIISSMSLSILVLLAGLFLLAYAKKEGLGKMTKFASYVAIVFGTVVFVGGLICSLSCGGCGGGHCEKKVMIHKEMRGGHCDSEEMEMECHGSMGGGHCEKREMECHKGMEGGHCEKGEMKDCCKEGDKKCCKKDAACCEGKKSTDKKVTVTETIKTEPAKTETKTAEPAKTEEKTN